MYGFNLFDSIIKLLLIPVLVIIGSYKLLTWFLRSVITETGNGLVRMTAKSLVVLIVIGVIGTSLT